MGTCVSALRPGSQVDDIDMLDLPRGRMPNAKDNLSKKFGQAAVMRGIAYDGSKTARVTRPSRHRRSGMVPTGPRKARPGGIAPG